MPNQQNSQQTSEPVVKEQQTVVEFVVPFLAEMPEGAQKPITVPNDALQDAYLASLRAQLQARTIEAIQQGAVAARVKLFVDFE